MGQNFTLPEINIVTKDELARIQTQLNTIQSNYVKADDLANYTKTNVLSNYAKIDDLMSYAKTTDLANVVHTDMLTNYAKVTNLSDYAKVTNLSDYAKLKDLPPIACADGGYCSLKNSYLPFNDTRSANNIPSYYRNKGVIYEFKQQSLIDKPQGGISGWCGLQTMSPWSDPSGGPVTQIAYCGDTISQRFSTDEKNWSAWRKFNLITN